MDNDCMKKTFIDYTTIIINLCRVISFEQVLYRGFDNVRLALQVNLFFKIIGYH